jgi:KDO2-lipid IV(A) lauroyltransferase
MAKERSKLTDYAVYLAVRALVCLIQTLSYPAGLSLARGLAWLAYRADRRHRLVADENLRHAFGEGLNHQQRDAMVRAVYRHFCGLVVTLIHLPRRLHASTWRAHLDLVSGGGRRLVEAVLSTRPALLVTGHFGNWEMGGYTIGVLGFRSFAIARTLDNPYLDRFLRDFRERTGQQVLAKQGEFDRIQSVLDGGGVLATLADQDAGQRGLFVEYFGRPASTHKAVALLALEYGVTLVVLGIPQVGEPMRYRLDVEDVIRPEEYDGRPDAVRAITERFTAALERVVRRHPEQYLWLHRRWKHQPQARKGKRAA